MLNIIFILLILALTVGLALIPWGVRRWGQKLKYPKWFFPKWVCICIGVIVGLAGTAFCGVLILLDTIVPIWDEAYFTKDPLCAKAYLSDIQFPIELPDFKVKKHTFRFVGGDDTKETWILSFKEPLSPEFIYSLDSLCCSAPRWSRDDSSYTYSYWDPEYIELHEEVVIEPGKGKAVLTHLKI